MRSWEQLIEDDVRQWEKTRAAAPPGELPSEWDVPWSTWAEETWNDRHTLYGRLPRSVTYLDYRAAVRRSVRKAGGTW